MPRLFAAAGALAAAAYLLVLQPGKLADDGHVLTARVMMGTAIPLVLMLGWMALDPESLESALRRVSKARLADNGHFVALLLLVLTLYYVIGFGSLVGGAFAYESATAGEEEGLAIDETLIVMNLVLNVIVLVLPVLLYVSFVHELGPLDALRALGFRSEGAPRALAIGVASAVGAIVLIALVTLSLQQGGVELPENKQALAIARSVSLAGALAIATLSALSEEVFFRGFLQPRVGIVGQAVLFSLAHLSYANATETVVTLVLAFAFAFLYRWTRNLWAPIAAHFAFNLIMLLAGMYGT